MWARAQKKMMKYAVLDDPEIGPAIIRQIAEDVLVQAIRDLKSADLIMQLDAAFWLAGPDLPLWLAVVLDDDPHDLKNAGLAMLGRGRQALSKRAIERVKV